MGIDYIGVNVSPHSENSGDSNSEFGGLEFGGQNSGDSIPN